MQSRENQQMSGEDPPPSRIPLPKIESFGNKRNCIVNAVVFCVSQTSHVFQEAGQNAVPETFESEVVDSELSVSGT